MAGERAVERALIAWREAERRLEAATPGTPAYVDAEAAVEAAHRAYSSIAAERFDVVEQLGELSTGTVIVEPSEVN